MAGSGCDPRGTIVLVGLQAEAAGRGALYSNAGHIPVKDSAINAVARMANDWERRLLGLGCGQVLPRDRHLAWARERVKGAKYLTRQRDRTIGVVLFARLTTPPHCEGDE